MVVVKKSTFLIFGATSGLGWQLAQIAFAKGHNLCVFGRRRERLNGLRAVLCKTPKENNRFLSFCGDITNQKDIADFVAAAMAKHGHFDYIVNCSAIFLPACVGNNLSAWKNVIETNFWGSALLLEVLLNNSCNNPFLFTLITSSLSKGGIVNSGPYACSKAALESLVRTAGKEIPISKMAVIAVQLPPFRSGMNSTATLDAMAVARRLFRRLEKIGINNRWHGKIIEVT